jgi:nitrite reductase/ring-hydroxylating ferredoxin subunit
MVAVREDIRMPEDDKESAGPDLTLGVRISDFKNDMLLGHIGEDAVLLVRSGSDIFAVDAYCSHYHGPLVDGLVVGHSVRCPWHHARFDLNTGNATCAPALSALAVWQVEQENGRVFVRKKLEQPHAAGKPSAAGTPRRVVIVGGGGAGFAAAEMLRREGFDGDITLLSADKAAPVDRPNLSKDYLAGNAPEEWVPLRPDSFYTEAKIDLRLGAAVTGIDSKAHRVELADGESYLMTACCSPPARSRFGCRYRAQMSRMSIHCARSMTAGPSSPQQPVHNARSSWARASSGLRLRRRCVPAVSRCMSWRPKNARWNASWGRIWATSCAACMKSTA